MTADNLVRVLGLVPVLAFAFRERWPSAFVRYAERITTAYCGIVGLLGIIRGIWYLIAVGLFGFLVSLPAAVHEIRRGVEAPDLRTLYSQRRDRKSSGL